MAIVASLIFPVVFLVMVIYQRLSTPIVRRVRTYQLILTMVLMR